MRISNRKIEWPHTYLKQDKNVGTISGTYMGPPACLDAFCTCCDECSVYRNRYKPTAIRRTDPPRERPPHPLPPQCPPHVRHSPPRDYFPNGGTMVTGRSLNADIHPNCRRRRAGSTQRCSPMPRHLHVCSASGCAARSSA